MKEKRKAERCYYCGEIATSREHIPPQMMFRGFACDRITVPSCAKHNNNKGRYDQAILSAFLLPLRNGMDQYSLSADVVRAIDIAGESFVRSKRRAISVPLLEDAPEQLADLPNVSYLSPSVKIGAWIRQLTAGLLHDATGTFNSDIDWDAAVDFSPNWIPSGQPTPMKCSRVVEVITEYRALVGQVDKGRWMNGWSASPRPYPQSIYAFQLYLEVPKAIIRHRIYERYDWYVGFNVTKEIASRLVHKVQAGGNK